MKELECIISLHKIRGDHKGILEPLLVFPEVCAPVSGLSVFTGFKSRERFLILR